MSMFIFVKIFLQIYHLFPGIKIHFIFSTDAVQVYTTNTPCGAVTQEYKGLVMASKVKSRNAFSDIGSGLKSLVGGEIKGLSKLTRDVREELIKELKETAAELGANAIVGLR